MRDSAVKALGFAKIHKVDVLLCPIISTIDSPTYALAKYLVGFPKPYIDGKDLFVCDSGHFIGKIQNISSGPHDTLVSSNVLSLFIMVPVSEVLVLEYIQELFLADITTLFFYVVTIPYFKWDGLFYEQTNVVSMGSPINQVVPSFHMEKLKQATLQSSSKKPSY